MVRGTITAFLRVSETNVTCGTTKTATTAVGSDSFNPDSDDDLPIRPAKRRKLQGRSRHSGATEKPNNDISPTSNLPPKEAAVVPGSRYSVSNLMDEMWEKKGLVNRLEECKRKPIEKPEAITKPNQNLHADETASRKDAVIKAKSKHVESPEDTTRASNAQNANEDAQATESENGDGTPLVVQRANRKFIAALQKRIESPAAGMNSRSNAAENDATADPRQGRADESIGAVNDRELLPSDLAHLQYLFKHSNNVAYSKKELLTAVFESWDTSIPGGERPVAPRIFQITSDMNRVVAGRGRWRLGQIKQQ